MPTECVRIEIAQEKAFDYKVKSNKGIQHVANRRQLEISFFEEIKFVFTID